MVRKSEAEVELIRESARWCEHAHRLLQQEARPGATEAEAGLRAGHEATLAMLEALGPLVCGPAVVRRRGLGWLSRPDRAEERLGARGRAQHRVPEGRRAGHRDGARSGATSPSWNARSSSARPPTKARMFDHMVAPQETAFAALRPAATCAEVDKAVRPYYHTNDLISTGGITPATPSGCAITKRRSSTKATRPRLSRAWCSRSSRACTPAAGRLPPLRYGRRHPGRNRCAHRLSEGHREPDHPGLNEARPELIDRRSRSAPGGR